MQLLIHYPSVYGILLLLAAINSGRCEERRDFYEYGLEFGDQTLPLGDESKSPPVTLPTRFHFFNTYYTALHVRKFAKISFHILSIVTYSVIFVYNC